MNEKSVKKVAVGLSGGVDSSVAAAMLIEQGYDVTGIYLTCWEEPGCRTDQDRKDALKVATQLGIRFEVLDFRKEYREKVVQNFYDEYKAGRTPNPDVLCNREIKFGLFYDWALSKGFDFIATGHYARICKVSQYPSIPVLLLGRPKDLTKDQTYFLWEVTPEKLAHVLFPLGEMLKSEVREKAKELNLPTASKPDSMGICFIGEVDVAKLLRAKLGEREGNVVLQSASIPVSQYAIIGKHRGLWFYTIGQRGGWEMEHAKQSTKMPPLYVVGKDRERNQLIVGTREQTLVKNIRIAGVEYRSANKLVQDLCKAGKLFVRIRNLGELYLIKQVNEETSEQMEITVHEPIFGVAEGQSAVLYDDEGVIVAGGMIS